jgi:hypothetical protein
VNRFVAAVPVDETPTAEMLDEIGPYTTIVPLVVEEIAAAAMFPDWTLPETIIVPIDPFIKVLSARVLLPITLPVIVTIPILSLRSAAPPIDVGPIKFPLTLTLVLFVMYTVPLPLVLIPPDSVPDILRIPVDAAHMAYY